MAKTTPDSERRRRRDSLGFKQALSIARQLGLSDSETAAVLASTSLAVARWTRSIDAGKTFPLPDAVTLRVSHLLSIWTCLGTLFPTPSNRIHWLRHGNSAPPFNGRAPIELLLSEGASGMGILNKYLLGERHA